jgi:hypothetical protein
VKQVRAKLSAAELSGGNDVYVSRFQPYNSLRRTILACNCYRDFGSLQL